ncbi:MAG: RluA family pseudouridine synthase [Anaerolineales bacterium]|nr:RluA family pseudouridine synthase [Anaerolineales bacterium]
MDPIPETLVLWSDPHILVVNKPPGLLSIPDGYDPSLPHLQSILEPHFGRLWIVHRLDRWTSGVVILARDPSAHQHLNTQFQEHTVLKLYHALVAGRPPWEDKIIDLPLRPDGDRKHRTVIDPAGGKPAQTELRVLHRYNTYTLLEATPRTGRTHQVRAHLSAEGFPVIADPLYGDPSHPAHHALPRLGLHASSLSLQHPHTEEPVHYEPPYPDDFEAALSLRP